MADYDEAAANGRALARAGIGSRLTGARPILAGRVIALLLAAAAFSAASGAEPHHRYVSAVLVAVAAVSGVLWAGWCKAWTAPAVLVVSDIVGAAAITALDGDLWAPALAMAAAAACQAAVFVPRRVLNHVVFVALALFFAVIWLHEPAGMLPGLVGLVFVVLLAVPTIYSVVQTNRAERLRLHTLLNGVEAVVWELDRSSQRFTYVSEWSAQFGLDPERWIDYPTAWMEFVHPDDRHKVGVLALVECADRGFSLEVRAGTPPMYDRVFRITPTLVGVGHPSERAVRGVMVDISDLRKSESLIRHQARHDALTGLANRAAVVAQLSQELASRTPQVALLLLDLDRFKEVNDALGHHRGDYLLQEVAKRLNSCLPSSCFVARLGGDEFAVVVPMRDQPEDHGQVCAEAIVQALCEPVLSDGLTMQIGVSIGIAVAPFHGEDQDQLFRRADMTMYVAKRSGGGWAMWRPEFEEESARSFQLSTALRAAIEDGSITMAYQPRVSVRSNRVLGFEALARWTDPRLGNVPPNEFVAAAQVAGLSLQLVSHIMRTSLQDFTALRRVDPTLVMAVNVTTTDLVMQGFDEMLFATLDQAGLPHGALILELSEGEAIQNAKLLHQVLTRLGERGIRLSIDDFGQGYSSMDRLRSLPLNEIKIDQAFVARMRQDPTDRAIVDSIVRLGHNLALDVVAEGVEDPAALQTLRELGCDAYQGTLFKGAVGIAEAVSLVRWQQPDPAVRPIQGPGGNVAGLLRPGTH